MPEIVRMPAEAKIEEILALEEVMPYVEATEIGHDD